MITENQLLDALRGIMDPDLGRDIVSLGFVKNIRIDGGHVAFDLELTTPACPIRDRFKQQSEQAVGQIPGVESVAVTLTARPRPQKAAAPMPDQKSGLEQVDAIVAVSSCKGGVGKSTVAAHLAQALQREGRRVGLLDADLYGPSFPTLFNLHRPEVYMLGNRIQPIEHEGLKIMSFGFLLGDAPAVLRGPIVSGYVQQLLNQTDWGKLDYLVIDMPPGTGDIQLTITQTAKLDGALIVTTPQTLSLVDVARGILMFERVEVPVLGIVENMSYFECDGCGKRHAIFGSGAEKLGERFGLPTLAEIPIIPGVSTLQSSAAMTIESTMRDLVHNLHRAIGRRRIETVHPTATALPGELLVRWPDGSEQRIPNRDLRVACACAQCVNEWTGEPILDPATIPTDIEVEEIQPLGNYAISITWSDGHGSGIYAWDLLRRVQK